MKKDNELFKLPVVVQDEALEPLAFQHIFIQMAFLAAGLIVSSVVFLVEVMLAKCCLHAGGQHSG